MTDLDWMLVFSHLGVYVAGIATTVIFLLFISRNLDPRTPGDAISKQGAGQ